MLIHCIVLILAAFSIVDATGTIRTCGANEQWRTSGYDCATCQHQYAKCALISETRCYCLDGYVRNALNKCVRPSECPIEPPKCPENEMWRTSGYDCATCQNYQVVECGAVNEAKCYCFDGYVRNFQGKCVPTSECPKELCTRKFEHFTPTTPCESICGGSGAIPTKCDHTQITGCVCDDGYVRCHVTGECVPVNDCYPVCENENEVPSSFNCRESQCIDNYRHSYACIALPRPTCKTECRCKEGFIREQETGCCIPDSACSCGDVPHHINN